MNQHNLDKNKLAKLEDYLAGDLPPAEEKQLRQELATDRDLANTFELLKKFKSQHRFQETETRLRKVMERPAGKYFREEKSPYLFRRGVFIAIAAMALLLLVSKFIFQESDVVSSLAAEYLSPPQSLSLFRSGESQQGGPQEQQIIQLYEAGDYENALKLMKDLQSRFEAEHSSEFYFDLGILQLFANHPSEALGSFQNVKTGHTFDLQWYRAWALLFAKHNEEAKAAFDELATQPNPFQSEAQRLLEFLP
ncbi:MAG: hypothetical protein Kow0027_19970 [Saprospiraceae bacterium]